MMFEMLRFTFWSARLRLFCSIWNNSRSLGTTIFRRLLQKSRFWINLLSDSSETNSKFRKEKENIRSQVVHTVSAESHFSGPLPNGFLWHPMLKGEAEPKQKKGWSESLLEFLSGLGEKMKTEPKKRWKSLAPLHLKSKSVARFCFFSKIKSNNYGPGRAPVYLNVYDLTPINGYIYWAGLGIFHSGVEANSEDLMLNAQFMEQNMLSVHMIMQTVVFLKLNQGNAQASNLRSRYSLEPRT
ncbi:hypothetical protein YC2023_060363 [Brassica napus]